VVRLSGLAQTNDRLAIQEMGKQIAEAEGKKVIAGEEDDTGDTGDDEGCCESRDIVDEAHDKTQEYAPTTLPSHLLALLTAPSPRAIIIVIEEFDLFTEHARQALLYCLCRYPIVQIH
jgi:origin recognition complex subunit 4